MERNDISSADAVKKKSVREFDSWAPNYDTGFTNFFFNYTIKEIYQLLKSAPFGCRLLDVGCGTGNLLFRVGKNHPGFRLAGIDLSPQMIKIAKSKSGKSKISFQEGSGDRLPYSSNYFDYVVCSHSLHHHPDPHQSLSEMTRVLKIGGRLIIVDGFTNGILRKINFFITQLLQKEGLVHRFKKQEMFDYFKKLGYRDIFQKNILYFNLLTLGVKNR